MECRTLRYLPEQDIAVPCGRCAFCLATKRSDWAFRLHVEQRRHVGSKFVTLTYADPHLVWKDGNSQLHKPHLREFFKNCRGSRGKAVRLRYFAVGEYGSKTYRPHYHVILFGDVAEDRIRASWKYGQVHVGSVSQASIMYCLGYVVNGAHWKMRKGREKPFATMSRRPGLGANYLSAAIVEWHRSDRKNYVMIDNEKRHLPRYFRDKIFSKIDRVRMSVRDSKAAFERDVKWLRSAAMSKMKDPLSYREEQLRRVAKLIFSKTKHSVHL